MMATVSTPYGEFELVRSDVVAITVVKVKRQVRHFRKWYEAGELTHIEHRRKPINIEKIKLNCGSWAIYMATFDLNGRHMPLAPHSTTFKKPKKIKKISKRSADLINALVDNAGYEYYAREYAGGSDADEALNDLIKARAALEKRVLFLESRQMVKVYSRT